MELAQTGRVPGGGQRPFGYEADRKTIRESEAALIREAAGRVLAGEGLRTVCSDWNARGVSTVTGVVWSTTTLRRLLKSGRIVGQREHHGRMVAQAEWPAIIDEVTGHRLRRLLDDPSRSTVDTTARSYLLAGMVRCGQCGATLVARPVMRKGHRYRRYACVVEKGGCNRLGIGAAPLEELITEAVFLRLDTRRLSEAVASLDSSTEPPSEVADIEQRMEDLAEMFAAGDITKGEWSKAREGLISRLEDAKKVEAATVRSAVLADQLSRPDVLRSEWPEMALERQRAVVAAIIDYITVAPTTKAGNKFDPERVDVRWKL